MNVRTLTVPESKVPAELGSVALIDATACAAAGSMSISQWHNLVREGSAPKPAVRMSRYTRWRMADVREFLVALSECDQEQCGQVVLDRATKASMVAKAKRQQQLQTNNFTA